MSICAKKYYFLLYVAMSCIFLGGCSQAGLPLASSPPLYEQDKIQSVDHWDTLAKSVVQRVQKSFEDRPDLIAKPIYITTDATGVFTRTFGLLVRSNLVSRGMQVAENVEHDTVVLQLSASVVLFSPHRGNSALSLAGLGLSVGNALVGTYGSPSDHEVVITGAMTYRNRYVMSLSQICYIHDADWPLYFDKPSLKRQAANAEVTWSKYAQRGQAFSGREGLPPYSRPISAVTTNQPYSPLIYSQPVEPIIEQYVMPSGGRKIDPSSPATPLGKSRR